MNQIKISRSLTVAWIWGGAPCVAALLCEVMYRSHWAHPIDCWAGVIGAIAIGGVLTLKFFEASRRERLFWLALYLCSSLIVSVVTLLLVAAYNGDGI